MNSYQIANRKPPRSSSFKKTVRLLSLSLVIQLLSIYLASQGLFPGIDQVVYVWPLLINVVFWVCFLTALKFLCRDESHTVLPVHEEWDSFVNSGHSVKFNSAAPLQVVNWLEENLPVLNGASAAATWIESLNIKFLEPVTIIFETQEQAKMFSSLLVYTALATIKSQLSTEGLNCVGESFTAVGKVILHGKEHSLVIHHPNADVMVIFLFRTDVVGVTASIICGGTHFIRRAIATGERARTKKLSDDEVVDEFGGDISGFLIPIAIPFLGLGYSILVIGVLIFLGLLWLFAWFYYTFFNTESGTDFDFGELKKWKDINDRIQKIDWAGLQPDRTQAIAEINYMSQIVRDEALRKAHSEKGALLKSSNELVTESESSANLGDYL